MQSATRNSANILEHMESYGKTAYGDLLQSYDIDDIFSSNIFLILCHSKLLTVSMTKIYGPSYTLWFHQTWQWTIPWLVRWFFQVETSIYRGFNKSHITISDYRRVNHPTQGFLHHPSSPCWRNLTNMASVKKTHPWNTDELYRYVVNICMSRACQATNHGQLWSSNGIAVITIGWLVQRQWSFNHQHPSRNIFNGI